MKMKKIALGLIIVFCIASTTSYAQFFKKVGDKFEKSIDRRIDRKTDKAVNKSLDKVEGGVDKTAKDATTSSKNKKKNETSEAGWPVSTPTTKLADNYEINVTGSGPDLYLNYQMVMEGEGMDDNSMKINLEMYTSPSKGFGRSEVIMTMPTIGDISMITLTNMKDPNHIVILNEKKKQYSIIDVSDDNDKAKTDDNYVVKKIGEVELHGMHCKHVLITNSNSNTNMEMWTTTDIPGYENMVDVYSRSGKMGSGNLWSKLKEQDCLGFLVKMKNESDNKKSTVIYELVKVKKSSFSKSMFLVPKGYTEKSNGWAKRYKKNN